MRQSGDIKTMPSLARLEIMTQESIQAKLAAEHQEIYPRLELLMLKLSKVKNQPDNKYLLTTVLELLDYVRNLLDNHFAEEERDWFPCLAAEDRVRLIADHDEIRAKYKSVAKTYAELIIDETMETRDLKETLLYPSYNLVATISHHAQREDSRIDTGVSILRF
jgi:hemerythrin-like domain-containing protein